MQVELTKAELEVIRHTLYLHRELMRAQCRLAVADGSEKAQRDVGRFTKIVTHSLHLDEKLSDALQRIK